MPNRGRSGLAGGSDRVAASHQPIAIVLDFVNPIGSAWWAVSGRRQAGLDKAGGRHAENR
jgi:hypothetical protein